MKSPLEKIEGLDNLIRQLQIMESKMRSGQFIDAWRHLGRVIDGLYRAKQMVVKCEIENEPKRPVVMEKPEEKK